MIVSYNNNDKVGTSFILGNENDIAKECSDLMFYKSDNEVVKAFDMVFKNLLELINGRYYMYYILSTYSFISYR